MDTYIEKIKPLLQDKLTDIAVYMFQTEGFPLETFNLQMETMNMAQQLGFVNAFAERHKKVVTPIYFSQIQ